MERPTELNGILTKVNLNVLPLGSYDALIGMDQLEKNRAKVDCYEKFLECIDEEGGPLISKRNSQASFSKAYSSLTVKKGL